MPTLLPGISSLACWLLGGCLLSHTAAAGDLPNAPSMVLADESLEVDISPALEAVSSSAHIFDSVETAIAAQQQPAQSQRGTDSHGEPIRPNTPVDANGNPISLDRQQPHRILGFMPNFRSVSAGEKVHPPGWKYNFKIATEQAFDYSSFIFLGLTTISAEGLNEHPVLGKGVDGFYGYLWRGFLDKTDGNYLQGWLLPSLLHEDTRYYPLGNGHRILVRELYVISRQGVTRTYGGRQTPNIAGLGGKVLTQIISRTYYPPGATSFGVLAEKFGYAAMRDVMFTTIREFYPDIAAHYIRNHRAKQARLAAAQSARDAAQPPAAP